MEIPVYAVDFESYYDKDHGIKEVGVWHYINDAKFDPYLMSIHGPDISWVGHPRDFDWSLLAGKTWHAVAHNAAFDRRVWDKCVQIAIIPADVSPMEWFCTANLSVFLGGPRSLKDASKCLLGVEVSKEMRNYMKGKTWDDAVADGKDGELKNYAMGDSINCYNLWMKYNHLWPVEERKIAEITAIQSMRGVQVDTALIDECLPKVLAAKDDAFAKIPWAGTTDERGDPIKPLSSLALKAWCLKRGIEVPTTTEADSPEFTKWQERHKDVTVISAMQTYRSANSLALKATTLRAQVRPDGRFTFPMLYFGATTGRWSAGFESDRGSGGGVNIQNLIKEEMYGLNLRKTIIAKPGYKFVISDYSQIEPRCLAWLCDDKEFMVALGKGVPLYEAHARAQGSWTGDKVLKKENALLYLQKKAEVLALGYGAGWAKFIFMCAMYGAEDCLFKPVSETQINAFKRYILRTRQEEKLADAVKTDEDMMKAVNAWMIVTEFRATKPQITGLWKQLELDCRRSAGGTYTIELPSGRKLNYFDVRTTGGLTVRKTMDAISIPIWGGFFTENVCQAFARDVLRDAIIKLEEVGIETLWTVHDELICEVKEDFDADVIKSIMTEVPNWCQGLPLAVDQEESCFYKK